MEKPKTLEYYYLSKPEPYQSCLLALREIILNTNLNIQYERKFQIPFFTYKGKKLGYLWLNGKKLMLGFCLDKSLQPLIPGVQSKDKYESIEVNPNEDIPVDVIRQKLANCISIIDNNL